MKKKKKKGGKGWREDLLPLLLPLLGGVSASVDDLV